MLGASCTCNESCIMGRSRGGTSAWKITSGEILVQTPPPPPPPHTCIPHTRLVWTAFKIWWHLGCHKAYVAGVIFKTPLQRWLLLFSALRWWLCCSSSRLTAGLQIWGFLAKEERVCCFHYFYVCCFFCMCSNVISLSLSLYVCACVRACAWVCVCGHLLFVVFFLKDVLACST